MSVEDEARARVEKLIKFAKAQANRDQALAEGLEHAADAVSAAAAGLVSLTNRLNELRDEVVKLEKAHAAEDETTPTPARRSAARRAAPAKTEEAGEE